VKALEIMKRLATSTVQFGPVARVSSVTGSGIEALRERIRQIADGTIRRSDDLARANVGSDGVHAFEIQSSFGELGGIVLQYADPSHPLPTWRYSTRSNPRDLTVKSAWTSQPQARVSFVGFGCFDDQPFSVPGYSVRAVWFPHWLLALLFAILPAVHLRGIGRTRRRNRAGLCQHCGYDLRATPDRCPECGTAVSQNSTPCPP
jgi:hypothetical protein